MRRAARFSSVVTGALFVALVATLTACDVASGPAGVVAATPQATTTTAPTTCAQISAFAGASAASAAPGFADVTFPSGSVSDRPTLHPGGMGLYAIAEVDVCTPATDTQTVERYFTAQLAAAGWTASARYPFDGGYLAVCGDPYCWFKDTAPRYVSLEQVAARGNGVVTYHLRLATPPPAPNCPSPAFQGPPYQGFFPTAATTDLPLPPLTEFGAITKTLNLTGESLCSAGTATTLNVFLQSELAALGWAHGSLPAADMCGAANAPFTGWVKGSRGVSWQATNGKQLTPNGVVWTISYCAA